MQMRDCMQIELSADMRMLQHCAGSVSVSERAEIDLLHICMWRGDSGLRTGPQNRLSYLVEVY